MDTQGIGSLELVKKSVYLKTKSVVHSLGKARIIRKRIEKPPLIHLILLYLDDWETKKQPV